jgi:hypothetical protein
MRDLRAHLYREDLRKGDTFPHNNKQWHQIFNFEWDVRSGGRCCDLATSHRSKISRVEASIRSAVRRKGYPNCWNKNAFWERHTSRFQGGARLKVRCLLLAGLTNGNLYLESGGVKCYVTATYFLLSILSRHPYSTPKVRLLFPLMLASICRRAHEHLSSWLGWRPLNVPWISSCFLW